MGTGTAGGAGTIVNAMATGRGAAFGLAFKVRADVHDDPSWTVTNDGAPLDVTEARLAIEACKQVCAKARHRGPHRIDVTSEIPPSRGLKSSSAVAVAIVRAAAAEHGLGLSSQAILRAAANAGLRSKTSVTGAFDDAAACLLGGVVVTDNARFRLLKRGRLPGGLVALVHMPAGTLSSGALAKTDFRTIRALVTDAWQQAKDGAFDRAMILNSAAYAGLLGHEIRFSLEAIREGAWAAGLSGKGPAEIALGPRRLLESLQARHPASRLVALRRPAA